MECENCGDPFPLHVNIATLHFHVRADGEIGYQIECFGPSDPQHNNGPWLIVGINGGEQIADALRALADYVEYANLAVAADRDADVANGH